MINACALHGALSCWVYVCIKTAPVPATLRAACSAIYTTAHHPCPQVITQASLILLLYGTLCGGLAFLSDVARIMVQKGLPGHAPALLAEDGRPVMVGVVLLVLYPLCLQRHIRQVS